MLDYLKKILQAGLNVDKIKLANELDSISDDNSNIKTNRKQTLTSSQINTARENLALQKRVLNRLSNMEIFKSDCIENGFYNSQDEYISAVEFNYSSNAVISNLGPANGQLLIKVDDDEYRVVYHRITSGSTEYFLPIKFVDKTGSAWYWDLNNQLFNICEKKLEDLSEKFSIEIYEDINLESSSGFWYDKAISTSCTARKAPSENGNDTIINLSVTLDPNQFYHLTAIFYEIQFSFDFNTFDFTTGSETSKYTCVKIDGNYYPAELINQKTIHIYGFSPDWISIYDMDAYSVALNCLSFYKLEPLKPIIIYLEEDDSTKKWFTKEKLSFANITKLISAEEYIIPIVLKTMDTRTTVSTLWSDFVGKTSTTFPVSFIGVRGENNLVYRLYSGGDWETVDNSTVI